MSVRHMQKGTGLRSKSVDELLTSVGKGQVKCIGTCPLVYNVTMCEKDEPKIQLHFILSTNS